jgi:hypothetical protein
VNNDFVPFIVVNSNNGPLKLLIDTGANKSFISPRNINLGNVYSMQKLTTVKNIKGKFKITKCMKFNPFPEAFETDLTFLVFEFHDFFDGLIGYESLCLLNASISTKSNTLHLPFGDIIMEKKYPETNKFQLNANETKVIDLPICQKEGDFLISKDIVYDNKAFIHSGLYKAENYTAKLLLTNLLNDCTEVSIKKGSIEANNFETGELTDDSEINNIVQGNLWDQLRLDHLNKEERDGLVKLISDYQQIFHLKSEKLTFTNGVKHRINTKDDIPVYTKSYRYPYCLKEEVQSQIRDLLQQGIIRPSNSPWSSPIWVVPKKLDSSGKKKWRLVVDYRKLNDKTIDDKYPIPNITEVLDKLGRCNYFTTLDLASGFHQIEVHPKDVSKTAFTVEHGKYEFLKMPFGLKNAPSTFQRVMDNVLRDLIGKVCLVYMDDIIVYSTSLQEHLVNLRKVFDALHKYNLKIQLDKSEFLCKEVAFLGHVVTSEGVKPNPDKILAIKNWPIPKTETELRGFLGTLGYYRRFIKDFARIVKPLTLPLRKGEKIVHNDEFIKTFNKCKIILTSSHVLQYPDFSKPFILTTDASNFAIGAVLSQGPIGQDRPVAYASRTLTKSEENYSVIEKEFLAITWGCKYFRPYLFGKRFTLFTDHKPLTYMFSLKDPNDKMLRWRLRLQEFDYDVKYRPGKQNIVADGLSRIKIEELNTNDTSTSSSQATINTDRTDGNESDSSDMETCHSAKSDASDLIQMTEQPINFFSNQLIFKKGDHDFTEYEEIFPKVYRRTITRTDFSVARVVNIFKEFMSPTKVNCIMCEESLFNILQIVYRNYFSRSKSFKVKISQKILVDLRSAEEQNEIIEKTHDRAHRGGHENYAQIIKQYYFPGMKRQIQRFVNLCETCLENKYERNPYHIKLHPTEIPNKPFQIIHLDIFISLPNIFLTAVDKFSRFGIIIPIKSRTIPDVRAGLVKLITNYAKPQKIITDNEAALKSLEIRSLLQRLEIAIEYIPSNHSETNGIVERFHSTLSEIFRCIKVKYDDLTKKQIYKIALGLYNQTIHTAHKRKPYEILFGQREEAELPLDIDVLFEHRQDLQDEVTLQLTKTSKKDCDYHNKSREDEPNFTENERVFNTIQGIKKKTKPKFKKTIIKANRHKTVIDARNIKLHKSKLKRKRKN